MEDDLDTLLVEFRSPVSERHAPDGPVQRLERFLQQQRRAFAIEEYVLAKKDLPSEEGWTEWFAEHPKEEDVFVAVVLVGKEDKVYFDNLFQKFTEEDWANQRPDGTSAKAPPSNPSQGAAVPHP